MNKMLLLGFLFFIFHEGNAHSPASEGRHKYQCSITRIIDGHAAPVEVLTLGQAVKFKGTEPHQELTLTSTRTSRTLSLNHFFENPSKPYFIDFVTCDLGLSCVGERKTYSQIHGVKSIALQTVNQTEGLWIRLKDRQLFTYAVTSDGFRLSSVDQQAQQASAFSGVEIACIH